MGIFGKVLRNVTGTNKNDVKSKQIDYKMEKMKQKNEKEEKEEAMVLNVANHIIENPNLYISKIEELLEDSNAKLLRLEELQNKKATFSEKAEMKKTKELVMDNLGYLYISQEFLMLIDRLINGVSLDKGQRKFIMDFLPFFDGRKVLENDESIMGTILSIKSDIISHKYDFKYMLENTYRSKIESLVIPDFTLIFDKIRNSNQIELEKEDETIVEEVSRQCSNCSCTIPSGAKFCPSCGAIVEEQSQRFCMNCGEKITPGAKFCAKCGAKIN